MVSFILMFVPIFFLISQGILDVLADNITSIASFVSSGVAKFIPFLIYVFFVAMPLSNQMLKLEVKV